MLPSPPIGTTPTSAPRTPTVPARPTMLLIASGKGGVGTSMIAALAALTASARGENVLLVDASESGGGLHHLFAVRPTTSIWSLTNTRTPVDDFEYQIPFRFTGTIDKLTFKLGPEQMSVEEKKTAARAMAVVNN